MSDRTPEMLLRDIIDALPGERGPYSPHWLANQAVSTLTATTQPRSANADPAAAAIDALRRVKENAEAWHGNGEDGPRRALAVIAQWCGAAVDAYETEPGTWDAWFVRHPGHMVNGYCLSHPPGCNRRCLDDRPQGPAPWEPAAAVVSAEPTEEQG